MKIKPMPRRILVKEIKIEEVVKGGLILPESAKNKALIRAEIIRVGKDIWYKRLFFFLRTFNFKKEDIVLYVEYSAAKIEDNGEEYSLVRDEDVLAVIEK